MSKQLQSDILKIRSDAEKLADKQSKKLMLAYKKSLNNFRNEISGIYAKESINGVLSVGNKQRLAILKSLDSQLRDMFNDLGSLDTQITLDILTKSYETAYYKTLYTLDKGLSSAISFDLLNPKIIDKAVNAKFVGSTFSDKIWRNKKLMISRLKVSINRAIIEGRSIDKLAKELSKVMGSSIYESKRLINSETARLVSNAQSDIYTQSEVVKKVLWDATNDQLTSDICADLSGQEFFADGSHPKPVSDSHPNCRCCLIPVVDGWSPTKKLDNETKEVIEYSTYNEWAKSKGIE